MACTKPQKMKEEESERLREGRDLITFIHLKFDFLTRNKSSAEGDSNLLPYDQCARMLPRAIPIT